MISDGIYHQLKVRRLDLGISQTDLAKSLGTRQSYVSEVEAGKRNISVAQLLRWCVLLKVRWFMTIEGEDK